MWRVLMVSWFAILASTAVDGFFFRIPTYYPLSAVTTLYRSYQEQNREFMTTVESQLDSFIEDLKSDLASDLPVSAVESVYTVGPYFCANSGHVSDLKSLKKSEAAQFVWNIDKSIDITLYLSLENFKTVYQVFHFENLFQKTTGNMVLTYGKSTIAVRLYIPVFGTAPHIVKEEEVPCNIYLNNFEWDELGDITVVTETGDSSDSYWTWLKKKNVQFFTASDKLLLEEVKSSVLEEMYKRMDNLKSYQYVCKLPPLKKLEKNTEAVQFTDLFKQRCEKI